MCAFAMAQELPSFAPFPSLAQSNSGSASVVGNRLPIGSQSGAASSGASIGSQSSATSISGASTASQSSATATSNAQASPDPNIELFAHSLINLLKSSSAFGSFGTFTEYEPYGLLFEVGYPILLKKGITDASSANLIAQTAKDIGFLSSDLFYSSMAHALAKFIYLKGALTQEVALTVPQEVVKHVETYAKARGVNDFKSVVSAVGNGFYDYLELGDLAHYEDVSPFQLFAEALKELASGANI